MEENQTISTWGYVGIILLLGIPVVGLIFAIVWACGGCKKKNKTNLARAALILGAISLIVGILVGFAVKKVVTDVMESVEAFSMLSENFEDVESLLGEDVSVLEGLSELENIEELGDLESLVDMENLTSIESWDDLETQIGSENMATLESMIDLESLGDPQDLDASDVMEIIGQLDAEDMENITQMMESLGISAE